MKYKNDFLVIIKGFIIGSSMSVPGISGGTMAILLGIYDKLIHSISNFLSDIKSNFIFLLKFVFGAGLGIGSLAFVIKWLLDRYPLFISFFFLGAVFGGIPALVLKTKEKKIKTSSIIYCLLGFAIVISIGFVPTNSFSITAGTGLIHYLKLLVTGIIIAIALVLPGISTSHMLIVLGMYDSVLVAITKFDIIYLGVLGISTVVGIFLITKPIEWAMNRYSQQTYFIIIGFVLGSTVEIFRAKILPAIPSEASYTWWIPAALISIVLFVAGFAAINSLSKYSEE